MITMNAVTRADLEIQIQQLKAQLLEAEQVIADLSRRVSTNSCLIKLSEAHLHHRCSQEDFNSDLLKANGWVDASPEIVPPSAYLAILSYSNHPAGKAELLFLCPSLVDSPIHIYVDGTLEIY